jgi:uncharacterized protein (UPF0297 family)
MSKYQILEDMLKRSVVEDIKNQLKTIDSIYFDQLDIEYKVFIDDDYKLDIEITEIKTPKEYLLIDLIANEMKNKIKKELEHLTALMIESFCLNEFFIKLEIYSYEIQSFGDSFYRDSYIKVKVQDCEAEKEEANVLKNAIERLSKKMYYIINQSAGIVLSDIFNFANNEDIDFEFLDDIDDEDIPF